MTERNALTYQALFKDFTKLCSLMDEVGNNGKSGKPTVTISESYRRAFEASTKIDNILPGFSAAESKFLAIYYERKLDKIADTYNPVEPKILPFDWGNPIESSKRHFESIQRHGNWVGMKTREKAGWEFDMPGCSEEMLETTKGSVAMRNFVDRLGRLSRGEPVSPLEKRETDNILDLLESSAKKTYEAQCKTSPAGVNPAFCLSMRP